MQLTTGIFVLVLEAKNLRSKCQLGWFFLETVRDGSVPGHSACIWEQLGSQQCHSNVPMAFSPYACLPVNFPSYKDTSPTAGGIHCIPV